MQILFSFTETSGGHRHDVWLSGEEGTPFSVLADALDERTGSTLPRAWWRGNRLLDLGAPIGTAVLEGCTLTHSPDGAGDPGPSPAGRLLAVGGPHAGESWPLGPGTHLIGRSDDAAVNLVDDPTVSRRHASLVVTATDANVSDAGSSYGTSVEGVAVGAAPAFVEAGAYVQVGSTVLVWQPGASPAAPVSENGEGGVVFNRPPRLLPPAPAAAVRFPGPPPVRSGVNFPLMATVAPIVLGVVLALALGQILYLMFTALSPVIGVSNYLSQRRSGAKSHRQQMQDHQRMLAAAEDLLRSELAAETARRRRCAPDPAQLVDVAQGPLDSLWERRRDDPDFMRLRAGLADLAAELTVEGAGSSQDTTVRLVPAVVDLAADGVLGIAGERRRCEGLARWLTLQAAILHAPEDLSITILTGPNQEPAWGWARWLPHVREKDGRVVARIASTDAAVARLAGEVSSMVDDRSGGGAHLVIVDGAYQLGSLPAVTNLLRRGPAAGVYSICIDDSERLLPEECHAVATFDPSRAAHLALSTGRGRTSTEVLADLVSSGIAERAARSVAPMRLNRRLAAGAAIPTSVRLLPEIGSEPPEPAAIAERWSASPRSTSALLGIAATGPFVIDLAKDGPHGLVAGTTGSGKSELLQTMIASLAVANRPDAMNFVLVDYKGGSAFKECARLPHTVGLVTDLDGHLTERALASIGAELRRREVILATAGAKDLEAYWRVAAPSDPPLGRLVIVIDEFASLVEELPTFVDGLVDLARRGRSLGIHLVLATQRPSGVVSAAIKTNTNLRIAMRVTDAADSVDVIDSPLASRITKGLPGRGYVRVGHDDLTEFQAARIGGRRPGAGGARLLVAPVGWQELAEPVRTGPAPVAPVAPDEEETDLSVLVDALGKAAAGSGLESPRSPWLPALPDLLALDPAWLEVPGGQGPFPSLFGLEDLPESQAQQPAAFDLARDGHLLALGDPGSGRSTLLRSLAAGLAARNSVADVHIYGIDCGNGALLALESLPHVGAVVTRREPDRIERLLAKLSSLVTERQQLLARGGYATIADQRRLASAPDRLPYVVVLLDRWEGFNAEFETVDGGALVMAAMHLMREGPGAGLRFVVTADRSGASPRFSSLAERILAMRLNDRNSYAVLGLNPRTLPDTMAAGRGFYTRGGTEVQVGLLDPDPSGPAQVAALEELGRRSSKRWAQVPAALRPVPLATLPVLVPLSQVLHREGHGFLVGVGGDRVEPVHVDPGRFGPGFVVTGPPRSGRSSALMCIALSAVASGGRVVAVTARPSPLQRLAGRPGVDAVVDAAGPSVAADLQAVLSHPLLTVVVDDAELVSDSPASDPLAAFLRTARDRGSSLVLAGTAGELGQFRGFIPETRKSKAGVLLSPGSSDGDTLGVRLPRTSLFAGPPGRGILVLGGEMTLVQVPYDDVTT